MNTVMSNASGSGVPFNCQNWLALGVVILRKLILTKHYNK